MTWQERIEQAKIDGEFSLEDQQLADQWPKCAVGEHKGENFKAYIFTEDSTTTALYELGHLFNNAVTNNDIELAEGLLKAIKKL